jgi:uncharacterized protein (TIGR02466 family)
MREILNLFPTPLHINSEVKSTDSELKFLNTVEMRVDLNPSHQQNYGDMSKDLNILNDSNLSKLSSAILDEALIFAKEVLAYDINGLQFTTSWVSIKNPGQFHVAHSHPNSIISGVYYFDDGTDIEYAPITFHRAESRGGVNDISIEVDYNKSSECPASWIYYKFQPKKNNLILFQSHLYHSVAENHMNIPRKCVAFNLFPTQKIGDALRLTQLIFKELK